MISRIVFVSNVEYLEHRTAHANQFSKTAKQLARDYRKNHNWENLAKWISQKNSLNYLRGFSFQCSVLSETAQKGVDPTGTIKARISNLASLLTYLHGNLNKTFTKALTKNEDQLRQQGIEKETQIQDLLNIQDTIAQNICTLESIVINDALTEPSPPDENNPRISQIQNWLSTLGSLEQEVLGIVKLVSDNRFSLTEAVKSKNWNEATGLIRKHLNHSVTISERSQSWQRLNQLFQEMRDLQEVHENPLVRTRLQGIKELLLELDKTIIEVVMSVHSTNQENLPTFQQAHLESTLNLSRQRTLSALS